MQLVKEEDEETMRQQTDWKEDEMNDAVEVVDDEQKQELKLLMQPMALDAALEASVRKEI